MHFRRMFRMSEASFWTLTDRLRPHLALVDATNSRNRSGTTPLCVEGKVACFLRYIAGGTYVDIIAQWGISPQHFYTVLHEVIDAVLAEESLRIRFPATHAERVATAAGFARRSPLGAINGCIGCIDGLLCKIRVPRKCEVARVKSFFSGHYCAYGVNVQGCCDYEARFTSFSCSCAGGTNDAVAFDRWGLNDVLRDIRDVYYVIGDCAYTQTLRVLSIFTKSQLTNRPDRDKFNYYASQLRVTIERAFGMVVNKWRILRSPLECAFHRVPCIIEACFRMHNFCIDERIAEGGYDIHEHARELAALNGEVNTPYNATVANIYADPDATAEHNTWVRDALVDKLVRLGLRRPTVC
eukprot:GHVU01187287.1.p1 GENE.GHVU01187287.1~~GHVU01187287.1.p1  ORF type:complete len:354 (-),score=11.33 GHVU01187287.1:366-1427(-)